MLVWIVGLLSTRNQTGVVPAITIKCHIMLAAVIIIMTDDHNCMAALHRNANQLADVTCLSHALTCLDPNVRKH